MKVYLPNVSRQELGGGFSFCRNLAKGGEKKFEVVSRWEDCDVVLIPGATIAERKDMNEAKKEAWGDG